MPDPRTARPLTAVAVSMVLGVVELVGLLLLRPVALLPVARPVADRATGRLVAWTHARRGGHGPPPDQRFVVARALLGVVGGYVAASGLFLGALLLGGGLWELVTGGADHVPLRFPGVYLTTSSWLLGLVTGAALLGLALVWVHLVGVTERWLAGRMLAPGERDRLRRRIVELAASRSEVLRAIDDERRRIERDLHDGVQQRGVALAMLLGRVRHDPGAATAEGLVEQAYRESRLLLDEVRNVAWRVYPTALDELGLTAALAGVAERSVVPVTVHGRLTGRPVSEVETALYFVAREAIANAVKHADARDVLVLLAEDERTVRVVVSDDGRGGADPAGGGLRGLARRVRALDGTFEVSSPPGGPTRITAVLPREVPCD
ncbi:sensor histidine kinase [Micromonospora rosaria]|nr:sensor histidine kinase [Micromonospora rosaria]